MWVINSLLIIFLKFFGLIWKLGRCRFFDFNIKVVVWCVFLLLFMYRKLKIWMCLLRFGLLNWKMFLIFLLDFFFYNLKLGRFVCYFLNFWFLVNGICCWMVNWDNWLCFLCWLNKGMDLILICMCGSFGCYKYSYVVDFWIKD